jgi:predicted hydrolase (HD superfamily)
MLSRFELFVVLRHQVRDRRLVRRALAVEAGMEELAALAGGDVALWGLAGMGSGIDAELTVENPARRGEVAEELLLTEGAPAEVAEAARLRLGGGPVERLPVMAAALAAVEALVAEVYAQIELGETLDGIDAAAVAHRLRRAATKRGDEAAERILALCDRAGVDVDRAAVAVVTGMRRVREDLRL